MYKHIVVEKIPGKRYGFNYIVACPVCATHFKISGSHYNEGRRVFCSYTCRGKALKPEKLTRYKTGSFLKNGYIMETTSPYMYEYKHRLVMEQHLGRKLESHEVVHHKDHNRQNNDISNLELTTKSDNSREGVIYNGVRPRNPETGRFL